MSADLPDFIEFHNTPAPEPSPAGAGWILPRFPRAAYSTFDSPGFLTAQESTGVELRFVTKARHLRVFVSALTQDSEVTVFKGDFPHLVQKLPVGSVQCLHLTPPDLFDRVRPAALHGSFHPDVWRIVFDRGTMVFHGIDTFGAAIRKPLPEEKPALRWLAYGSSITHSSRNGYPHRTAAHLRVDVENKGQSGSCYLDAAAADFIATGTDWDFATFELGINMRGTFTPEEFARRARYLVTRCTAAKPARPVVLITLYRNSAHHLIESDASSEKQEAFNRILRDLAAEFSDRHVHLVEGTDIVDDLSCLTSDLLHPNDSGHARMAANLARFLQPLVTARGAACHSAS
jgi:lysophospholipase L1-like esterase